MARPTFWNQEKILNKIQEFINNNGRIPTTREMNNIKGFPKKLSIQMVFNMSYDNVIKKYFKEYYRRIQGSKYYMYSKEQLLNDFKNQFIAMGYPTKEYYNKHRAKGSPQCNYIAKLYNITYSELLEMCKFEHTIHKEHITLQCTVIHNNVIDDDIIDKIKEIIM